MVIFFNIVEDRKFDPLLAHIIITDELNKFGKTNVVYLPLPSRYPRIRKRLTRKMIRRGIDLGICYLYPLYFIFNGGLRDGIISEIKKNTWMIKIFNFPERNFLIIVTNKMDTRKSPPVYNELLPPHNGYSVIVFNGICGIKKRISKKIINNALSLGVFNWVEERTGRLNLAWASIYRDDEVATFSFRKGIYNDIAAKLRECGLLK